MNSKTSLYNLRAGVIGTGFIGPVHVEALRRLGVQVIALCDLPGRVKQAADRLNIPRAFTGHRAMLADQDIDVVHITAPNRFHYQMSMDVLAAGKHCICEKPLAMDTKQTAQIVKCAAASNLVFAVNYNVRFYPAVLQMRSMLARGDLGTVIHVNGSYMQDWLFKDTDYNWRLLPQEGGKLRAVADIGTHWMDTASFIIGMPITSVLADLGVFHKQRRRPVGEVETFAKADRKLQYVPYPVRTEDYANVLLKFGKGIPGNLAVSQVAAGRKNALRIEIYGSKKSAWWSSENPEKIVFGNRDGANEIAVRNTPVFADAAPFVDYPAGHVEGFPDTFKMLFRSVYSAIAGANNPRLFATAQDGHQEVAVCEAIIESHKARRWVCL